MGRGVVTSQQRELFEDYDGFVEKFKPKRTTDDCYTPPEVYEVIRDWACAEYGIDPATIVRPFYPGGDYEAEDYDGKVVLDNPPFSMLTKICEFYLSRGVPFFLFAPSLTLFGSKTCMRMCHILCDACIEYENGAVVRTGFVTSYDEGIVARTAPELGKAINAKVDELHRREHVELPKYEYPDYVVTAAMMQRWSKYGIEFEVRREDCAHIGKLDAQKERGKTIFGSGLLLSERAAAERAAAERAAAERAAAERAVAERAAAERARAHVWELSDRERAIVSMLGGDN